MAEIQTKPTTKSCDIIQMLKDNGFEYKQSDICFETYFSHSQSVLDMQILLEKSVVVKYNQSTKQSYLFYIDKNQKNCTQIADAKIAKQILQSSGHFAWCEYTCTNTIFEKQDIQITLINAFDIGEFLEIKSPSKNKQELIEISNQIGIKNNGVFDINIGAEYYKKNYEENI